MDGEEGRCMGDRAGNRLDNGAGKRGWRMGRRAQVSLEYTIISAVMLVVLAVLMVTFNGLYSQYALKAQYQQATHAISVVGAGATDVWKQGKYARQQVLIDIPAQADLSRSNISKNVLDLYVENMGDASMQLPFLVSGNWPAQNGRAAMLIYNNGTGVSIMPAGRLELNVTGLYYNNNGGSHSSGNLLTKVTNRANASYSVAYSVACQAAMTCIFYGSNPETIASGATPITHVITASVAGNKYGLYSGYLNVTATPASGSGLPTETFIVPIQLRIT